jgi:small GTP-binding protein
VGKTAIITRYIEIKFNKEDYPTIGADCYIKQVKEDFKIYIWEIAGAKDRLFASEYLFIQSVGAMVVFDIANQESFTSVDFWIKKIKEFCGDIPLVIIGNGLDKSDERRVKFEEANEKAKKYNVRYIETSAKTGNNIDKAFDYLVAKVSSLGMVNITNKELLNKPENENLKNYIKVKEPLKEIDNLIENMSKMRKSLDKQTKALEKQLEHHYKMRKLRKNYCTWCGSTSIIEIKDKSKILYTIGSIPIYEKKKNVCLQCGFEWTE